MKNNKHNRRRALESKLIKKSDTYPGYYKYEITVGEKDGSITSHPVYGKDMQNALSRLLKQELTDKVERKLETNVGLIFGLWLLLMGAPSILFGVGNTPWVLLYTFGSIIALMIISTLWYNHIKKGTE